MSLEVILVFQHALLQCQHICEQIFAIKTKIKSKKSLHCIEYSNIKKKVINAKG